MAGIPNPEIVAALLELKTGPRGERMITPKFKIGDQLTDRSGSKNATDSFIVHRVEWDDRFNDFRYFPDKDDIDFPEGQLESNLYLETSDD